MRAPRESRGFARCRVESRRRLRRRRLARGALAGIHVPRRAAANGRARRGGPRVRAATPSSRPARESARPSRTCCRCCLLQRRAIISTGTHTLQDQLFGRDLPLLGAVIGRPMEVAVLKGRSNYLCWHRLDAAARDGTRDAPTLAALRALDAWGQTSDTGDLTELEDLADDHRNARPGHFDRRQLLGKRMRVRRSLLRRSRRAGARKPPRS